MASGAKTLRMINVNNLTIFIFKSGTCKYESVSLYVLYYNIFCLVCIPSDSVTKFVNAVSDLELSMQQLNSTNDMLNLEIDGEKYYNTSSGQSFQSVVHCPDGKGRNTYFCRECFILH